MVKKSLTNISEHFIELENRISKVRFARIEASKRLKFKNQIYTAITSLYGILITFLAIVFSIVNFTNFTNISKTIEIFFTYQQESVIILAFSSFITMLTLYISNKGYGEKAARFQSNYMELTRLHSDVKNFMVYYHLHDYNETLKFKSIWVQQKKNKHKSFEKRLAKKYRIFADKYAALLTQSENHENIDYYQAVLDNIKKQRKSDYFSDLEKSHLKRKINFYKFLEWLKITTIALFPALILLLIKLFSCMKTYIQTIS